MLIAGPTASLAGSRPDRVVQIDVAETTLRLALSFVAEDAGWRRGGGDLASVIVSDRLSGIRPGNLPEVLVARLRSADCRAAVEAVTAGHVTALLCADEPDQLPAALDAAISGFVLIPQRIITVANAAPALDQRLRHTLVLVATGHSNRAIARHLQQSESTAKRDVGALMRLFNVTSRAALADVATRTGYYRPLSGAFS